MTDRKRRFTVSGLWRAGLVAGIAWVSCGKEPIKPPPPPSENLVNVRVQEAYTRLDSLDQRLFSDTLPLDGHYWESGSAFKIVFSPDTGTWDPAALNGVILYNVYRQFKGSSRPTLVQRSFGTRSGYPKNTAIVYQPLFGEPDSVRFDSVNYVYDAINNYNLAELQYAVSATIDLVPDPSGRLYTGGFENGLSYSDYHGGGYPTRFVIENGRLNTPDREVAWGGQIDMSGLSAIIVIRYSEISTLDSAGVIADIAARFDSLDGAGTFVLNGGYDAVIRPDSTLQKRSKLGAFFDLGKIGRIDTVRRADFQAYFSVFETRASDSMALVSRNDTLVDGLGKKWIAIKGLWDTLYAGNRWNFVSDDISVRSSYPYLSMDKGRARFREKAMGVEFQQCLLDDEIPFEFNTFGDTTFSDTIQVWIAARGFAASFFNSDGAVLGVEIKTQPLASGRVDSTVYDYFVETPPQKFVLNSYGLVRGNLTADFQKGFRVSPLRDFKDNNDLQTKGLSLRIYTPDQLARTVRPGSLMGFEEADTNRFLKGFSMASPAWDTLTFFASTGGKIVENAFRVQGWHIAADDPRFAAYKSRFPASDSALRACIRDYIPERFYAYDNTACYLNPFRSLPLNVPEARSGYKEFIIVVHARGRLFNEPRVFISSGYSGYQFVWDKVPPQIAWAAAFNPMVNSWYAPMYYRDAKKPTLDRVTNLSVLNNVFRVCLSDALPAEKDASIRDVGFGKIVSAVLCFHYAGTGYTADPVSGLRTYDTPVKRYPLPSSFIASQEQYVYGPKNSKVRDRTSYAIPKAVFEGVDARMWKSGIWDMWIETEDDFGNKGIAPFGSDFSLPLGNFSVRQIEIK